MSPRFDNSISMMLLSLLTECLDFKRPFLNSLYFSASSLSEYSFFSADWRVSGCHLPSAISPFVISYMRRAISLLTVPVLRRKRVPATLKLIQYVLPLKHSPSYLRCPIQCLLQDPQSFELKSRCQRTEGIIAQECFVFHFLRIQQCCSHKKAYQAFYAAFGPSPCGAPASQV